jgi:hypothetical protein
MMQTTMQRLSEKNYNKEMEGKIFQKMYLKDRKELLKCEVNYDSMKASSSKVLKYR